MWQRTAPYVVYCNITAFCFCWNLIVIATTDLSNDNNKKFIENRDFFHRLLSNVFRKFFWHMMKRSKVKVTRYSVIIPTNTILLLLHRSHKFCILSNIPWNLLIFNWRHSHYQLSIISSLENSVLLSEAVMHLQSKNSSLLSCVCNSQLIYM